MSLSAETRIFLLMLFSCVFAGIAMVAGFTTGVIIAAAMVVALFFWIALIALSK